MGLQGWDLPERDGRRRAVLIGVAAMAFVVVVAVATSGGDQALQQVLSGSQTTSTRPPAATSTTAFRTLTTFTLGTTSIAPGSASSTGPGTATAPSTVAPTTAATTTRLETTTTAEPDTTTPATTKATTPTPGNSVVTVTLADGGKTVTVVRGDTVIVQLDGSSGAPWSFPRADSSVLTRTSSQQSNGAVTTRFTAAAAGTAQVTSESTPTCVTATPQCGMPTRLFSVTIVVEG